MAACAGPGLDAGVIKRGTCECRRTSMAIGAIGSRGDVGRGLAPRRLAVVAGGTGAANVFMIEAGSGKRDRVSMTAFTGCIGDDMRCWHALGVRAVVALGADAFRFAVIVAGLVPTSYGMAGGARIGGRQMVQRFADGS